MAARFIALCVLFLIVVSVGFASTPVQAQNLVTCPEVVQQAIGAVGGNCGALDRNSACYGFQSVSAEFSQEQPADYFSVPSDRARLIDIERIGTSPLNEALNQWGIALMSVQANLPNTLPGQSVVFMLLGDSKVENAVAPEDALQGGTTLDITLDSDAPLHHDPTESSPVLATVPAGTALTADALSEDGSWLRVVYQGIPGWVPSAAGSTDGDLSSLEVIGPDSSTPMQSFYFQSGITSTQCVEAPNALVVQGPQDLTVDIQANGADIQLGSTIVLYQIPVDAETQAFLTQQYGIGNVPMLLQIVVLDGHVVLNKGTPQQIELNTGETTFRCLSDTQNLGVNGLSDDREVIEGCPWAEPRPVTISEVEPYRYLENLSLNYPISLPLQLPPPITTTVVELPEPTNTPQPTATVTPLPTATQDTTAEPSALETEVASVFVPPSPPIAKEDSATTDEDIPVTINVLANDVDLNFDPMTVTEVTNPPSGSAIVNGDNTITYTPDADLYGTDSFTYTISDGNGGTDTATVNVMIHAVNDPPIAVDDPDIAGGEDPIETERGVSVTISFLQNDQYDVENDPFGFDCADTGNYTQPDHGTAYFYCGEGTYAEYVPDPDYAGSTDSFTYTIQDIYGAEDTATITITILANNNPPVATDDTASTNEGVPVRVEVLTGDSDFESPGYLRVVGATGALHGTLTWDDYYVYYTPTPGYDGTDTFDYTIQDAGGLTDTGKVTVTIADGNSPPTAQNDNAATTSDVFIYFDVAINNGNGPDTDPDLNQLTVQSVTQGTNGGTVELGGGTYVYYTPPGGAVTSDTFTYTITDGSLTATATVTVTITINGPPVANDIYTTTPDGEPVTIEIIPANASDPDSDPLYIYLPYDCCTYGYVTNNGNGTVTYTPTDNSTEDVSFVYTVYDLYNHEASATVNIDVTSAGDPPSVFDDSYSTLQDFPLDVAAPGVLANDSDPDGDSFTAVKVSDPTLGTITDFQPDGSFTYEPPAGVSSVTDTFTYKVVDSTLAESVTATVSILIGENTAPLANPDAYTMLVNGTLTVAASGVLGNDLDPDGLGLTVVPGGTTSNGTLTLNPDGSFTYTPAADFVGIDSFTYQASDGLDTSPAATVKIGVGVSSLVAPSTRRPLPYPTQTPLAPFIDYTYLDEMVRSSVPEPLRYTVFGRMIVRNRVLLPSLNYGYIGDQSLIDMGIIHAIDIFSTDGVTDYGVGVGVCMKGQGRLFFLNANFTPRSPIELDWSYVDGYTCGTILAPGIVVLVDG